MRTHDQEIPASEAHRPKGRKEDHGEVVASLALAVRRPSALRPDAVAHLQRAAGNASVAGLLEGDRLEGDRGEPERSPVKDVVGHGGGQPLQASTRSLMESRLGADFGDVRVHTDAAASDSARAVQAQAYTVGNEVVFQGDQYAPGTDSGQHMLAHELTHVIQQRSGPVDGTPTAGGIQISDPSDRFEREAESTADRVMSGEKAGPLAGSAVGVQRQEEEAPEEEVQGSFLQRQEEEMPEEEGQG